MTQDLDRWLSPEVRAELEQLYYSHVNIQARFEALRSDPSFLESLVQGDIHVGLYADHGVVHARDVAHQTLAVLSRIHGLLIPLRPPWRLTSMQGYGVLLAYFHDIGMLDFSAFGRAMHPEFATHSVFSPQLDAVVDALWQENSANLAWRLSQLAQDGVLTQPPRTVLRELLALAMAHSKSKVPVDVLNDRARLRARLIEAISSNLRQLYGTHRIRLARQKLIAARERGDSDEAARWESTLKSLENALIANREADCRPNPNLARFYGLTEDAYSWLTSDHSAVRDLADDAIDTVRALRCADALRQRGTVLKTSGGYEVYVSRRTGMAVYSLQSEDGQLYLLEVPQQISAGEANIASSELDPEGNLRISFHRGIFDTPEATEYAVQSAAAVVEDIQMDVITSFRNPALGGPTAPQKSADAMLVLLEEADDSVEFVERVRQRVEAAVPELYDRVQTVPSLRETSTRERELYLSGRAVDWDLAQCQAVLERIGRGGHLVAEIAPHRAFKDVRLVDLHAGAVLIEAGAPSAFVYVPLDPGLEIIPLGGYDAVEARPWTPLGITGVIRGAPRNATVVARQPLRMIMIPKGVYLREWHYTHTPESFTAAVEAAARRRAESGAQEPPGSPGG